MFILRRLARLSRTVQFALVAVAAFAIGSATVAAAATAGIPIGSLFYLPMINGIATAPCSSAAGPSGATTTCNAIVDSNGNLHVASTGTSTVSGAVSVNNLPADQQVHGTVGVNNMPDTQKVTGHVNVDNLPATQSVSGLVGVSNFPTDQQIHGSVTVTNLPAATAVTGVTVIPLTSKDAASGATREWAFIDTSSCRAIAVAVLSSGSQPPTLDATIHIGVAFDPQADMQQRAGGNVTGYNGGTWAFLLQPGTGLPLFAPAINVIAKNNDPTTSTLEGNVYCSH